MSDRPAFADIYEVTIPAVWRFVRSRVSDREQAEDITSEVYVRALAAWDRFDEQRGTPTAWLCGIATHAVQESRRRPRAVSLDDSLKEPPASRTGDDPQPEWAAVQAEEIRRVREALASLGDRERDALAQRFAGGLRASEVALILGLSVGATKMLLFRSMRRLRETLELEAQAPAEDRVAAVTLDETVDRVLARRGTGLPEDVLDRLVRQLAIIHDHPTPIGLAEKVSAAVACPISTVAVWPGLPFRVAAMGVALASLVIGAWRWREAIASAAAPDFQEVILLAVAGFGMLLGLALLVRRPTIGSGTIGLGALIFAVCLWWTGIAPLIGLVMAGAAVRQAARSPDGWPFSWSGAAARKG
jgi:RNA polymerase sigma factor (sigma-70 family)